MQNTQQNVRSLVTDTQFQKIKQWLAPPDPSTNFNDAKRKRHLGTGAWLLKGSALCEWESCSDGCLLLLGLSGCGKTVLTSTIMDHLCSKRNPSDIMLSFDFRDNHKRTLDQLLRSLAFQLYTQPNSSRAVVDAAFDSSDHGQKQPATDDLSNAVKKMMQTSKRHIFVVLDALDECAARRELVTWLEGCSNQDLTNVSFIATSRPEVEFESSLAS